jgi:hypothetical protein
MSQNKFSLILIFIFNFIFSQQKVDTVYVYEEVIVHDTIYIEKSLDEININKAILTKGKEDQKLSIEVIQNGKKIKINLDTIIGINKKQIGDFSKKKSWFFGGKLYLGLASNSLFKDLNAPNSIGFGLGIWTRKQVFNSNFSIGIGLDGLYWSSPFSFDASQNISTINGFYFVKDQPLLFKGIESKHFEVQIPLQFYYKYKKFMPSIGVFTSISNYKSEFIGSSGNLPLTLDETKSFGTNAIQFGYLAALQYEITKKIAIGLNFSSGSSKNLIFTNNNEENQQFKTQNAFKENRLLAELFYKL